jgi:ribulose 1,5-bisphosphate synthetase/thiazole synthase
MLSMDGKIVMGGTLFRKRTFGEELVTLLDKHGVEYDEQSLFD